MSKDPKIITFYSYKGGVGRSMALANVAWILAENYKVIVIDWDLEAPGLHRFFNIPQENIKNGLIDLFYDYKDLLRKDEIQTNEESIDIEKYLEKVTGDFYSGSIFLLPAGRFVDQDYDTKVNNFNWEDFYENWHGYGFIEYLKEQLKEKADIILIDSRTGITDIGGICTTQMPDVVVLLFSLNKQNIFGIESICEKIEKSAEFTGKKSPRLILIPSRVEKYLENNLLNIWSKTASQCLGKYLINGQIKETPGEYVKKNLIPYLGFYSFGEKIVDKNDVNKDLATSYENLKNLILKEIGYEHLSEDKGKVSSNDKFSFNDKAISFPECIYALGGTGKELIYKTLKQEWLLKEILKPDLKPNKCVVIIIDTCLEDENQDLNTISVIKEKIHRITEEYIESTISGSELSVGELKIYYHLLNKELLLERPVDLGGINVIETVLKSTDAEFWWINDKNISDDWYQKIQSKANMQSLVFDKGVYRKRAIAKAIYYKALSENKFQVEVFGRNIDIICGFGGGTGSGIALSLAKKIKEIKPGSDIHLFGVIPTLKENTDEKANCAATLSELEYMKVASNGSKTDEDSVDIDCKNIFENIILLPIEPTEYEGEQNLNNVARKKILEYDDVFSYVLIAFHNTKGAQPYFLQSRGFAPFCIAIPQLVYYNVNYIKQIKDTLTKKISNKKESLDHESKIYELVNSYLATYFYLEKDCGQENLLDEDISFINERYKQLKIILNDSCFDKFQYEKVLTLNEIVKKFDGQRSNESEPSEIKFEDLIEHKGTEIKIEEIIKGIQSEIEAEGLNYRDGTSTDTDHFMYRVLGDDLDKIGLLIKIIKKINTLSDDLIQRALKSCVKPQKDETLGNRIKQTKDAIETASEEKRRLSQESEKLEKEFIEFKERIEKAAKDKDKKWKEEYKYIFNELREFETVIPDLKSSFESVIIATEIYVNEINRYEKESIIKEIETTTLEKKFLDFFRYGIPAIDYHEIILKQKEIKIEDIKSKRKLLFVDRIIPGETKTKIYKKEARDKREYYLADLNRLLNDPRNYEGIRLNISFSDSKFSYTYSFDVEEYIYNKWNNFIEIILTDLKDEYLNEDTEALFKDIESKLKYPTAYKNINIEDIVRAHEKYSETIAKYQASKERIFESIENISMQLEKYTGLQILLSSIAQHHKAYLSNLSKYQLYFLNADKSYEDEKSLLGKSAFITEIQPKEIFEILASPSDINSIIRDNQEKQILTTAVKDSFLNVKTNQYNALAVNSFSTVETCWNKTTLGCALVTKATDIGTEVFDGIYSDLRSAFCLTDRENFNNWIIPYGDDWGVGIVSFIAPIPLDDIYNFVDVTQGYFEAYQRIKSDPEKLCVLHNSLLLEKGKYVERKEIFDLRNSEEVKKQFSMDDRKTKELISNNLEVKSLSEIAKTIK